MRVADRIIMDALVRGGCIKTFYRMCAKKAAQSELRIPEGNPGTDSRCGLLRRGNLAVA